MMAAGVRSCGILLFPRSPSGVRVLLGHMGGPFWARRDLGAWTIPKGEAVEGEADLAVALREFAEEMGSAAPDIAYSRLGAFRLRSGKIIVVFTAESDFSVDAVASNLFHVEWPPHSGQWAVFPEIDRAGWFGLAHARKKVFAGSVPVIDALEAALI